MRKIRLDAAIATRAGIKSYGNIVEYYCRLTNLLIARDLRPEIAELIKSAEGRRVFLGFKAKMDLVESYPRDR